MKNILSLAVTACFALAVAFAGYSTATASSNKLQDKYKEFVKTKSKCEKSNCSCSGYWGYKHNNGTYEGSCSNSDGHGHTCGHSPQNHGLKAW